MVSFGTLGFTFMTMQAQTRRSTFLSISFSPVKQVPYLVGLLERLNEIINIMSLKVGLEHDKHSINTS